MDVRERLLVDHHVIDITIKLVSSPLLGIRIQGLDVPVSSSTSTSF